MITDMILTLWGTTPAGIAIMGYAAGRDVIHCGLLNFTIHPVITYHLMFVIIPINKGYELLNL